MVAGYANASTTATTTGQTKRADLARIAGRVFLEVIADVPDCAVVARINRRLCVVLPAHSVLRRCAFSQHSLAQGQQAERVTSPASSETLSGKVRRPTKRVTDADVA